MMAFAKDVRNRFTYQAPTTPKRRAEHERVRFEIRATAMKWNELLPDGREKSMALTKLQEAMWAANAAVAMQPPDDEEQG